MPRRRFRNVTVPRRLDRRRPRGNATDAQHRPSRRRRGEVEAIAERRAMALELRKAGAPYRAIARQLGVDVHTAHADIAAELAVIRETTIERAGALRELELERCDAMTAGLWPRIQDGNPPAVVAGVRVSERRARLLGLDAPTDTRTELSASLSVAADTQLTAMKEDFLRWLDIVELQTLAAASDKLFTDAMALVESRKNRMKLVVSPSPPVVTSVEVARAHGVTLNAATAGGAPVEHGDGRDASGPKGIADGDRTLDQDCAGSALPVGVSPSPTAAVEDVEMGEPVEPSTASAVAGKGDSVEAETAPRE